jgi:hypothetical protein
MLRVLLDESTCTHEGGWHPEDKQHEDLLIQEFAGARVSSSTRFIVDWKSSEKTNADYYMYYSKIKV